MSREKCTAVVVVVGGRYGYRLAAETKTFRRLVCGLRGTVWF